MPTYRLVTGALPDWAPLEQLRALCAQRPALPQLYIDGFMYMGCLTSDTLPVIHLYKNAFSRHYLCLDRSGHTYRVRWQGSGRDGHLLIACTPHRTPLEALERVLDGRPTLPGMLNGGSALA